MTSKPMNIELACSSLWNYNELGSIAVYYSIVFSIREGAKFEI